MIPFVVNILFALFLGLNVWGYVSQPELPDSAYIQSFSDDAPVESPLGVVTFSQGPSQNLLSRLENGNLFKLLDRRMVSPWSGSLHGSVPATVSGRIRIHSLSPVAYDYPKDYFVYTLERMLC